MKASLSSGLKVAVFILLLILAVANVVFATFALNAHRERCRLYQERHELIVVAYDIRLTSNVLGRMVRLFSATGRNEESVLQRAEELPYHIETAMAGFLEYGASPDEFRHLENIVQQQRLLLGFQWEAIRLRLAGYYDEASDLAHSPEKTAIDRSIEAMWREFIYNVYDRITGEIHDVAFTTNTYHWISIAITVLLGLAAFIIMLMRITPVIRVLSVSAFFVAVFAFILSLTAMDARGKMSTIHHQQTALISASYDTELAAARLTKLSRMFVITGDIDYYYAYWEELAENRFSQTLDTFVHEGGSHDEINLLTGNLSRLLGIRHFEAQTMPLRLEGDVDGAMAIAFGEEIAILGVPAHDESVMLRDMIHERSSETLSPLMRSHRIFMQLTIGLSWVLFAFVLVCVFVVIREMNEAQISLKQLFIFRHLKTATIAERLVASFSMVIVVYIIYVAVTLHSSRELNFLNYANSNYIQSRFETLLTYQYEFTDMRLTMRKSFLSSRWVETAHVSTWRTLEQSVTNSYARLSELKEIYVNSVQTDPIFHEQPNDSRLHLITQIHEYAGRVYQIAVENFFLDGALTLDYGDFMYYTRAADAMIGILLQMTMLNQEMLTDNIARSHNITNTVNITALVAAIALTFGLSAMMVNSFTGRVKTVESYIKRIRKGDFSALEEVARDEISDIVTGMAEVFNELASEINRIAEKYERGSSGARMNATRFEGVYHEAAAAINKLIETIEENKAMVLGATENSMAKTRFLARMSHEIRTPITAVIGISEIQLQNPMLSLDVEEAFAKIYDSADILLNIINDILDISKIEAGKMDLIEREYEVASLITDTIQMHLIYLGSKNVKLEIDVDKNTPAYLIGDELRVKQILSNLLSNAFKYTEKGTISIALHCETAEQETVLCVKITDTGKGMTPEQIATIGEYTRFHMDEAHFTPGTGLGMPIVHNFVELMHGSFKIESTVDVGTAVSIRIPQKISRGEVIGAEGAANLRQFEKSTTGIKKRLSFNPEPMPYGRVLVVDDVDTNLYVACGLLGFYDLKIDTAMGGREAIEMVKGGNVYDIIFMDHMMPELNGMETTKILRDMGYTAPIITLTANALIGQAEGFMENGFDAFMSKPIQIVHLNAVLRKYIRDKQPPEVIAEAKSKKTSRDMERFIENPELKLKMRRDFLRNRNNAIQEIADAIEKNDFTTATRLAHTLKSLAGLIGENDLLNLARQAETALNNSNAPEELLTAMGLEMQNVLSGINEQLQSAAEPEIEPSASGEEAKEILGKLIPLLEENRFDAVDMVDELAKIPGTGDLIRQIEGLHYTQALETACRLMEAT